MAETIDLGPLTLTREGDRCRFTLSAPDQMTLTLPPGYEEQLAERLAEVVAAGADVDVVMDLQDLPAISSRQLGVMLALQKALRGRDERLHLAGTSDGVQRLLKVTRTEQFFELL